MNIGFIGLGKLGFPVAIAIASKGHNVFGYDIVKPNPFHYKENGLHELLDSGTTLSFCNSIEQVIENSEIVFVAVQTPHAEEHEGTNRITSTNDFNYEYLIQALIEINTVTKKKTTFALISTVAPNTYKTLAWYINNEYVNYCYNPFFIAMGTVIQDFLNPEFVLIGGQSNLLKQFYATIHSKPVVEMSIVSAEITKMAYNTIIGTKIVSANNLMEMAEMFGGNVDDITGALKLATDRLVSTKYMDAGMGDGGGCHPRDGIVLSHLAKKHGMSTNLAGAIMHAREKQAEWLVDLCMEYKMPVCVLGQEFKPETNIKTGSAAVLCLNILKEKGATTVDFEDAGIAVYLIGCKHQQFTLYRFPEGSVVIDPHRYIADQDFRNK